MLVSVSKEGHPDHHFFEGNFSATGATVQLQVTSLMRKGEKTSLKNSVYKKICNAQTKSIAQYEKWHRKYNGWSVGSFRSSSSWPEVSTKGNTIFSPKLVFLFFNELQPDGKGPKLPNSAFWSCSFSLCPARFCLGCSGGQVLRCAASGGRDLGHWVTVGLVGQGKLPRATTHHGEPDFKEFCCFGALTVWFFSRLGVHLCSGAQGRYVPWAVAQEGNMGGRRRRKEASPLKIMDKRRFQVFPLWCWGTLALAYQLTVLQKEFCCYKHGSHSF